MRRAAPAPIIRVALALAGLLALLVAAAPAASANYDAQNYAAQNYVALGDSYSSGVGAGGHIGSSGGCDRSTNAYSALWAAAHSPASYRSVACSGATTGDVVADQVASLNSATSLASITIGGNDVNFAGVMQDCVIYGTDTCVREINAAENTARTRLPGWLDNAYGAIRSHAPNARVVVLSYPRFYDTGVWWCVGLSSTSRNKINEGAGVLDGVIQSAAARHGFAFADVRSQFAAGHEICDGDGSWLHSVDWSDLGESYHPTAAGQSGGYLPTFSAAA